MTYPFAGRKALGIIGGMGPGATAEFFERVVRATPVTCDQDHLRILIDNNPLLPDRTAAIASGQTAPVVEGLAAMAQGLVQAGAQVLAVPCNTAHYFLPQIQDAVDALVVDMIAEACVEMAQAGAKCVGLLGTTATVGTGLYTTRLAEAGIRLVAPAEPEQEETSALIHTVKVDGATPDAVGRGAALVEHLRARGAEMVISGCTELSMVLGNGGPSTIPVFDPMDSLVRAVLRECLPGRSAP